MVSCLGWNNRFPFQRQQLNTTQTTLFVGYLQHHPLRREREITSLPTAQNLGPASAEFEAEKRKILSLIGLREQEQGKEKETKTSALITLLRLSQLKLARSLARNYESRYLNTNKLLQFGSARPGLVQLSRGGAVPLQFTKDDFSSASEPNWTGGRCCLVISGNFETRTRDLA